jgi:hypothetical protein
MQSAKSQLTFQRHMSTPSSGSKNELNKNPVLSRQQAEMLDACFTLVSCLAYFSALKMEATCSSDTSVDFQ